MKQELLEYLIRHCVKEVLSQMNEADNDTVGASAPPADGQGTADQPPVPKGEELPNEKPSEPETPAAPPSPNLKGVVFINPKDKAKLQKLQIQGGNDAALERNLYQQAARMVGPNVKIALSTLRMVKDALKNPNTTTYLYLGKYDPNSEEVFLMADKSIQVAKDSSITSAEMVGTPISTFNPQDKIAQAVDDTDYAAARRTQTPRYGIDEQLTKVIKKMVNEVLDGK